MKFLPTSVLIILARQMWNLIIYPLLKKFVDSTPNIYDDKALQVLDDAIAFVCDNLGANKPLSKLSNK
ncbi:MAG: hypothetical protein [Microvirus sp.]|nr:MAG: hypothetical protein [Microvirus sp.]